MSHLGLANDILAAARSVTDRHPRLLVFGPVARGNPYQELLYSDLRSAGIAAVPALPWTELAAVTSGVAAGVPTALHLHWTTAITGTADSEQEVANRGAEFVERLQSWKQDGLRFIWTVHNRLPHGCRFPEAESQFRASLAQQADVIHVMSQHAPARLGDIYELPQDRVVVLAHPAYDTAYPTYFQREDCRLRLGIDHSALVVCALGAMQPYKNLPVLVEGVRRARAMSSRRIQLIVAGDYQPGLDDELDTTIELLNRDPDAIVDTHRVADRRMAEYFAASDLASACYDSPIVSGSSVLALSLGCPVLAIDGDSARELIGDAGFYVSSASADAIAEVLNGLDASATTNARHATQARRDAISATDIAKGFTRAVNHLLA